MPGVLGQQQPFGPAKCIVAQDLVHWRRLRQVSLVLRGRQLEKDLPLMALALDGNLTDLHLRWDSRVGPRTQMHRICMVQANLNYGR